MSRILQILFVFMFLFTVPAFAKPTPETLNGIETVSAQTVKSWLDDGKDMVILDPRKRTQFMELHLPEAISCPVNLDEGLGPKVIAKAVKKLEACKDITSLPKTALIVPYCNSVNCFMSPKAALALVKMGYTNVKWMREGINGWKSNGFPLE